MVSHIADTARQGLVYGYATVDLYRILHDFALDPDAAEFKAPLNSFGHSRNVARPEDRTIVAMNVDTPYSYAWLDLRAEPVVVTLPEFDADRYVSTMFVDLATYILGYVSPRTNGNRGGRFLVTGPGWSGDIPPGIDGTFRCPTMLCLAFPRTQLFGADDIDRVATIQDRCAVQTLSEFLDRPSQPTPPLPDLVAPVDVRREPDTRFFAVLTWMTQLMPARPEDEEPRQLLAEAGLLPYHPGTDDWSDQVRAGMAEGLEAMQQRAATVRSSAELFGSREQLGTDPMPRAVGAMLGILGNSAEEYLGVGYQADAEGKPFNGRHPYAIHFAPGQLPPVDAFWSITLYDVDRFLYANEADRYTVGSRDVPTMVRDDDGGVTVHVAHRIEDRRLLPNWLPCPDGPFSLTFRTYLPRPEIRDGRWTAPPVTVEADPRRS